MESMMSILLVSGMGLFVGIVLLTASKKFYVYEDPKVEQIDEILPAANCGACGFPGCKPFAEAKVQQPESDFICTVGGNDINREIADILGVEYTDDVPRVAVLLCQGTDQSVVKQAAYDGIESCQVADMIYPGDKECSFGCLGLGDCVRACPFDCMKQKDGIIEIDEERCTGCTACISVCPKNILQMLPRNEKVYVACLSNDKGGPVRKYCDVGCTACKKCEKACNDDAIKVENFLSVIDQDKCTLCGDCIEVCPSDTILAFDPAQNRPFAENIYKGLDMSSKRHIQPPERVTS